MPPSSSVHLIVQRYRYCKLLLEEKEEWVSVGVDIDNNDNNVDTNVDNNVDNIDNTNHCGLLVYVSLAASATEMSAYKSALHLLNLPILTTGLWGDGNSTTLSLLDMMNMASTGATAAGEAAAATNSTTTTISPSISPTSIVIVPQANLISKVKCNGKSVQYHGQIDKARGQCLYHFFCNCIRGIVLEKQFQLFQQQQQQQQHQKQQQPSLVLPDWYIEYKKQHPCLCTIDTTSKTTTATAAGAPVAASDATTTTGAQQQSQAQQPPTTIPPSVPPERMFLGCDKYSQFDETTGMPTADVDGQPLTKSALKKLRKAMDAQRKKHEKWKLRSTNKDSNDTSNPVVVESAAEEVVEAVGTAAAATASASGEAITIKPTAATTTTTTASTTKEDQQSTRTPTAVAPITTTEDETTKEQQEQELPWSTVINPSLCQVIVGSFGKRQGLVLKSDMGPFCHTVRI